MFGNVFSPSDIRYFRILCQTNFQHILKCGNAGKSWRLGEELLKQCVGQNHKKAAFCTNVFKQYLRKVMHIRVEVKTKKLQDNSSFLEFWSMFAIVYLKFATLKRSQVVLLICIIKIHLYSGITSYSYPSYFPDFPTFYL